MNASVLKMLCSPTVLTSLSFFVSEERNRKLKVCISHEMGCSFSLNCGLVFEVLWRHLCLSDIYGVYWLLLSLNVLVPSVLSTTSPTGGVFPARFCWHASVFFILSFFFLFFVFLFLAMEVTSRTNQKRCSRRHPAVSGGTRPLVPSARGAARPRISHTLPLRGGKVQALICTVLFCLCDPRSAEEVKDMLLSWQLWSEEGGNRRRSTDRFVRFHKKKKSYAGMEGIIWGTFSCVGCSHVFTFKQKALRCDAFKGFKLNERWGEHADSSGCVCTYCFNEKITIDFTSEVEQMPLDDTPGCPALLPDPQMSL